MMKVEYFEIEHSERHSFPNSTEVKVTAHCEYLIHSHFIVPWSSSICWLELEPE